MSDQANINEANASANVSEALTDEQGKVQFNDATGKLMDATVSYFVNFEEKPLPNASIKAQFYQGENFIVVTVPRCCSQYDVLVNLKEHLCGVLAANRSVMLIDEGCASPFNSYSTDVNGDVMFTRVQWAGITEKNGKTRVAMLPTLDAIYNVTVTSLGSGNEEPIDRAQVELCEDNKMYVGISSLADLGNVRVNVSLDTQEMPTGLKVILFDSVTFGYRNIVEVDGQGNADFSPEPQQGFTNDYGVVQVSDYFNSEELINIAVCSVEGEQTNPIEFAKLQTNSDGTISITLPRRTNLLNDIQVQAIKNTGGIFISGCQINLYDEGAEIPRNWVITNEQGVVTFEHPNVCLVKYDSNGATGHMDEQLFEIGVDEPLLHANEFVNNGEFSNFDRWNTKADGSGESFGNAQLIESFEGLNEQVTLYAIWIPAFWLAPALHDPDAYKHPSYGIKKSGEAILNDVNKIKQNSKDACDVIDEYRSYMLSDNIHLYTKTGAGIDGDDYVEFRIINVGPHNAIGNNNSETKAPDATSLTFQTVYPMPFACKVNQTNTNVGGWAKSELRARMQPQGDIYELFDEAFTSNIMPVTKFSSASCDSGNNEDAQLSSTDDSFWIMSMSEIGGIGDYTCWDNKTFNSEGDVYQFWSEKQSSMSGLNADFSKCFDCRHPRSSESKRVSGYTITGSWTRSCYTSNTTSFFAFDIDNDLSVDILPVPAFIALSVPLCFAF